MKKRKMPRSRDRRVFRKTYDKTKRINVRSGMMRGGIRL